MEQNLNGTSQNEEQNILLIYTNFKLNGFKKVFVHFLFLFCTPLSTILNAVQAIVF